jgi:hypothetical protein
VNPVPGYICMICAKTNKSRFGIKRHMRDVHVPSQYHCPPCDRTFRNRTSIYDHIKKTHPDWNGVSYDDFLIQEF